MSSGDFQVLGNYNKTYNLLYAGKLNVLKKMIGYKKVEK